MFDIAVTPDFLSFILAGLTAIVFDWFPGLAGWYRTLSELKKRQIMAAVLLVIVLAVYLGSCTGIIAAGYSCDKAGFAELFQVFLVAIGINQGVHLLAQPSKSTEIQG